MGWKATLRAMEADKRRQERESQKRQRELEQRAKEQAKLSAIEQARLEVETFENQLDGLVSIHKKNVSGCCEKLPKKKNWQPKKRT
jgi:hypothetical protein